MKIITNYSYSSVIGIDALFVKNIFEHPVVSDCHVIIRIKSFDDFFNTLIFIEKNSFYIKKSILVLPCNLYWESLYKRFNGLFIFENKKKEDWRSDFYAILENNVNRRPASRGMAMEVLFNVLYKRTTMAKRFPDLNQILLSFKS